MASPSSNVRDPNAGKFPNVPQVEVQFSIMGDFDPARLTQMIGVPPSSTSRRGTRIRTAKRVVPVADRWALRINELDTVDATPLLERAVAALEPLAGGLMQVRRLHPGADMRLIVVAYVPTDHPRAVAPSLALSHRLLRRLADLGVMLVLDYMLLAPDEEDRRWQLEGAVRAD